LARLQAIEVALVAGLAEHDDPLLEELRRKARAFADQHRAVR
jgi:hypothetical protein